MHAKKNGRRIQTVVLLQTRGGAKLSTLRVVMGSFLALLQKHLFSTLMHVYYGHHM
jgi:hypothetical protein